MTPDEISAVARDPTWLAHRYDPRHDAVHFVRVDRAQRAAATFLTDEYLPKNAPLVLTRASVAGPASGAAGPLHHIFHSAFCCSTLMMRAFDQPGWASALSEPVILNDLAGWRSRGAPPAALGAVVTDAAALLARPFEQGEAMVSKGSNTAGIIADLLLRARPESRAIVMHAPIRTFLTSVTKKGLEGRLWVRGVFLVFHRAGLTDFGFDEAALFGQTDLQIAALGWLAQHRLFHRLVSAFGPARLRTLDSETFLAQPEAALAGAGTLFALPEARLRAAEIAAGPVFQTNSKTGERFGERDRRREYADAATAHADEIEKVAIWTERVAEHAGTPLALPAQLVG